jgi:hypothetical protein
MHRQATRVFSSAISCAVLLSACSALEPKPYNEAQTRQRIMADQARMYQQQEPVSAPLTFYDAAARALKYNLDYRLKLMESALAADLPATKCCRDWSPRLATPGVITIQAAPRSASKTASKACAHPPPKNATARSTALA